MRTKNSYTFTAKQQVKRNIFWCAIATCSTVCDAAVNILYLFIQFLEWYFNDDKCFQIWNWFTRMYRSSICSPQGNIYKFYSSSNRFGCTYISAIFINKSNFSSDVRTYIKIYVKDRKISLWLLWRKMIIFLNIAKKWIVFSSITRSRSNF